jgi:hypothetical protein
MVSYLPEARLTPGDVSPLTSEELCDSGFTTRSVRHVSTALRKAVFAEYGIPWEEHALYEVDHLIPLEAGGSNDIKNLWPELRSGNWNSYKKDRLENRLHVMICSGEISLADAQAQIATNWIAFYKRVFGDDGDGDED